MFINKGGGGGGKKKKKKRKLLKDKTLPILFYDVSANETENDKI